MIANVYKRIYIIIFETKIFIFPSNLYLKRFAFLNKKRFKNNETIKIIKKTYKTITRKLRKNSINKQHFNNKKLKQKLSKKRDIIAKKNGKKISFKRNYKNKIANFFKH